MPKCWRFRQVDPAFVQRLEARGLDPILARILVLRGIKTPEDAERFLEPKLAHLLDPNELPGCARAAELLLQALQSGRKITVYGDYDADGITATAILCRCLRLLGGKVETYVPSRFEEGYGLNQGAIEFLAQGGTELLITVDCGISSLAEVELARQLGMTVIVTDHHCLPSKLPEADAVVHPGLDSPQGGYSELSGAGVAFKLAWQLCRLASQAHRLPENFREFLLHATGLAAVGTIGDVVSLEGENRVLVHCGLHALARKPFLGIQALLDAAGVPPIQPRDSEKIAFQIAPRLNAAGRLSHASLALELLLTDSPIRAREVAEELQGLNRERQFLEQQIAQDSWRRFYEEGWEDQPAIVLDSDQWHPGVIGIVAGRMAEVLQRPVVLIASDRDRSRPAIGSARAGSLFNVFAAISACQELLRTFGGHSGAAGFTLEPHLIPAFREKFLAFAARVSFQTVTAEPLWIEAEVPLGTLVPAVVAQLEKIGPFGHGNPRPVLAAANVQLAAPPQPCGPGGQHLQLILWQQGARLKAVAFKRVHWLEELSSHAGPIDIAFHPVLDDFGGERRVKLHLLDWQATTLGSQ
jgi:single-stranded-DNA-specific exonuclease